MDRDAVIKWYRMHGMHAWGIPQEGASCAECPNMNAQ